MFCPLAAAATRCHERPSGAQHAAPASRRAARGVPRRLRQRGALRRTASASLPSAPRAASARGSAALGAPRRCPRATDFVFDAAGSPPRAGQTTPALRASCSRPPAPVPGEAGRYPPAAALLVRRLVVPVLNKLLQLPLHPLAGAWRVCSSSGKGPRGKAESLARCLSPPRACPPFAGGLVAVVVPRVRRADCPLSAGCCVTAPAAYPPCAPEWSPAALCGGRKLQRSTLAACFRLCRPLLLSRDFRSA